MINKKSPTYLIPFFVNHRLIKKAITVGNAIIVAKKTTAIAVIKKTIILSIIAVKGLLLYDHKITVYLYICLTNVSYN
jgi:hypothetical protein